MHNSCSGETQLTNLATHCHRDDSSLLSLQQLDLSNCSHLTDHIWESLSQLPALSALNVSGCALTGSTHAPGAGSKKRSKAKARAAAAAALQSPTPLTSCVGTLLSLQTLDLSRCHDLRSR